MMRRNILFLSATLLLSLPWLVLAVDYELIAPIPGGGDAVSGFEQYVRFLFPFLLLFASAAALVMFTIGSVYYIYSASNPSKLERAKEIMRDAVLGLLLALASVLILQTINPKLVTLDFDLPQPGVPSANGTPTTEGAPTTSGVPR